MSIIIRCKSQVQTCENPHRDNAQILNTMFAIFQLMQFYLNKSILYATLTFVFLSVIVSMVPLQAHGDGFAQENVYANVGNRTMAMFIKINPPILTSENLQDRYMELRFFDAKSNNAIKNVSFWINVTKGDQPLMYDLFYTDSGNFTIKFQPGGTVGQWTVAGDHEGALQGWTSVGDIVNVQAPILSESGLYHFNMALLAYDYPNTLSQTNTTINFDSYLSVGDIYNQTINYNSNSYSTKLISYYDKINNFNFDPSKLQASWSMPFDWNPARYKDRPLLVHEEFRIPNSFGEFANTPVFSATVNGNPVQNGKVVIDQVTIPNTTIAHLFVYKDDIQRMVKTVGPDTKTMDFAIYPSHTNVTTSTDIFTDLGGWETKLGWSPEKLDPFSTNALKLTFWDQLTGQQVTGDVKYDLKITTGTGIVLILMPNLVAKGGTGVESLTMPSNGIYKIQVNVTSVTNNAIPDASRTGVARGNIVIPSVASQEAVPEFPVTGRILIIGFTALMVFSRTKSRISLK